MSLAAGALVDVAGCLALRSRGERGANVLELFARSLQAVVQRHDSCRLLARSEAVCFYREGNCADRVK